MMLTGQDAQADRGFSHGCITPNFPTTLQWPPFQKPKVPYQEGKSVTYTWGFQTKKKPPVASIPDDKNDKGLGSRTSLPNRDIIGVTSGEPIRDQKWILSRKNGRWSSRNSHGMSCQGSTLLQLSTPKYIAHPVQLQYSELCYWGKKNLCYCNTWGNSVMYNLKENLNAQNSTSI